LNASCLKFELPNDTTDVNELVALLARPLRAVLPPSATLEQLRMLLAFHIYALCRLWLKNHVGALTICAIVDLIRCKDVVHEDFSGSYKQCDAGDGIERLLAALSSLPPLKNCIEGMFGIHCAARRTTMCCNSCTDQIDPNVSCAISLVFPVAKPTSITPSMLINQYYQSVPTDADTKCGQCDEPCAGSRMYYLDTANRFILLRFQRFEHGVVRGKSVTTRISAPMQYARIVAIHLRTVDGCGTM